LSLPISPTTILAAAQAAREVAGSVASGIAEATGFDEVLRGASPQSSAGELNRQLVESIQKKLGLLGIGANPPIELAVTEGGQLQMTGDHQRAAEIESVLSADADLTHLAERLFRAAGPARLAVSGRPDTLDAPPPTHLTS